MDQMGERLLDASISGNIAEIRELLSKGANVNYPDQELGDRPLHRAAMEGRVEAARVLIENHADVNAADNLGSRPLHWAADDGNMDMIRLLVESGAQAHALNSHNQTAADWAEREGHSDAARFLRRMESLRSVSTQPAR